MNRIGLARFIFNCLKIVPHRYPVHTAGTEVFPFFIFGSGRNGSTMLNRMLNQHPGLYLPSEQYFLGPSIFKFRFYNFMLWRDLVKVIAGELTPGSKSHTWADDSLPDLEEMYRAAHQHRSLHFLLDKMYRQPAVCDQRWGDSTFVNTWYIREIFQTFPRAQYIFLIRDGRDVVASFEAGGEATFEEYADPVFAARFWMKTIRQYLYLKKRTAVQLVRYEDLVQTPEAVLTSICDFLGVDFDPAMLTFHEHIPGAEFYKAPEHRNLQKQVFCTSIGRYKQYHDQDQMELVTHIMKSGLSRFGYL